MNTDERFRYRFQVKRVYRRTRGAALAEDATANSPANGGTLKLESVADFNEKGGVAWFEFDDDEKKERFRYQGRDEATDRVTGVTRDPDARQAHADGTFVQAGKLQTRQRWADGYLEDEDKITSGIRIPNHLAHYFDLGERRMEEMEACWVGGDERGLWVTDVDLGLPLGAVFSWLPTVPVGDKADAPYPVSDDAAIRELTLQVGANVVAPLTIQVKLWRNGAFRGVVGVPVTVPIGANAVQVGGAQLLRATEEAGNLADLKRGDFLTPEFLTSASAGGSLVVDMRRKV